LPDNSKDGHCVRVLGSDGALLAESRDIQHNRNYGNLRANSAAIVTAVAQKLSL
jgi:hypothetical protein